MSDKSYFNHEMYECLNKYANQPNNRHNDPEQQHAYNVLVEAYKITEKWAQMLQEKLCPNGYIKLRKSPVNQGNYFAEYNWAKIYPSKSSPINLALTVGINTEGATFKIDTVNADNHLQEKYLQIRNGNESVPIVHSLPKEKVLSFTFDELVKWSLDFGFELLSQYDSLVDRLGLTEEVAIVENKEPDFSQVTEIKNICKSLNQILYGPPGTGKTYHTIEAAVRAAEPEFSWQTREELKSEYDRLVAEKRIRFVTFHQSYGYEEFVEGLSVRSVEGEAVYYERDGIFKQIVDDAMKYQISKTSASSDVFDSCWLLFLEQLENDEDGVKINTKRTFFTVTAIDNGTIRFEKDKGTSVHSLNVKTLKAIFDGERMINGGLNPYYSALINYLRSIAEKLPDTKIDRQNFVLVIDEINRGNISKIFGELITLLEPSKRYGSDEALALALPYSGETFKVPDNLYIIGTMNTADRSLATMDTALRRRFDFVEMMPKPELLESKVVSSIDLTKLLKTMNQRIEVLYDREHTLGHAFFMPIKELVDAGDQNGAFTELVRVFQNKIIPLLQEYFFDDWEKIRLVLGDNQKTDNEELQLIIKTEHKDLSSLFGKQNNVDPYGEGIVQYRLRSSENEDDKQVWHNPQVYLGMYQIEQGTME